LSTLLGLTSPYYGELPSLEFSQAIGRLEAKEIMGILAELDSAKVDDPRSSKIQLALFEQWAKLDPDRAWLEVMELKDQHYRTNPFTSVLAVISRNDPKRGKELISQMKNPNDKRAAIHTFIGTVASVDPQSAFDLITATDGMRGYHSTLFYGWTQMDPAGAMAKLDEVKGLKQREQTLSGIVRSLGETDPERALEFAAGLENKSEMRHTLSNVLKTIARDDPQRALKLAGSHLNSELRADALSDISSIWLSRDPDAALEWINSLPANDRNHAIEGSIRQAMSDDIVNAVKLVESMPSGSGNSHHYYSIASRWADADPDAAAEWVKGIESVQAKAKAMNGLISNLVGSDPKKAAIFLEEAGINSKNTSQIGSIVAAWEATDPGAALDWMNGLDLQGEERSAAIKSTVKELASQDPERASVYVQTLTDPNERESSAISLMSSWARVDPDAAKNWAMTHLEGESKTQALGSLINQLSEHDVNSAISLYDEMLQTLPKEDTDKHLSVITSQITSNWAQNDPNSASEWLLKLPEGSYRSSSISQLVDRWGDHDIDGAANFVLSLKDGNTRDQAVARLAQDMNRIDPEAAMEWAQSIGDERWREHAVRSLDRR
jgi:hypothetical protein